MSKKLISTAIELDIGDDIPKRKTHLNLLMYYGYITKVRKNDYLTMDMKYRFDDPLPICKDSKDEVNFITGSSEERMFKHYNIVCWNQRTYERRLDPSEKEERIQKLLDERYDKLDRKINMILSDPILAPVYVEKELSRIFKITVSDSLEHKTEMILSDPILAPTYIEKELSRIFDTNHDTSRFVPHKSNFIQVKHIRDKFIKPRNAKGSIKLLCGKQ